MVQDTSAAARQPDSDNELGVGKVIDPTKNVLDLVKAESKYQDGMREAAEKYQNAIRDAENRRLQSEAERLEAVGAAERQRLADLDVAETRRIDDLEKQRVRYETRIAEDLRVNVKTTSDQLAGQLVKETGALNNQINTLNSSFTNQFATLNASLTSQITGMTAGINTRLSELEKFRWETGGKSAISDPALTAALERMTKSIAELRDISTRGLGSEEQKMAAHSNQNMAIIAMGVGIAALQLLLHFIH